MRAGISMCRCVDSSKALLWLPELAASLNAWKRLNVSKWNYRVLGVLNDWVHEWNPKLSKCTCACKLLYKTAIVYELKHLINGGMGCRDTRISRLRQCKNQGSKPVSLPVCMPRNRVNGCDQVNDTTISMNDCLTVWEQETQLCNNDWSIQQYGS